MPGPDHNQHSRGSSSLWSVLAILTVVACLVYLMIPKVQPTRKRPIPQAWKNMREIALALHSYRAEHGRLPYDPRGSDHALYALADIIPASHFDTHPHRNPRPEAYWNHEQERLVASDVEYLNPDISVDPSAALVVLIERKPERRSVLLGLSSGFATHAECPDGDCWDLLGSWETWDGFLVADGQLYRDWNTLEPPRSTGDTMNYSGAKLRSVTASGVRIAYEYDGEHLRKRTWRFPRGIVSEILKTDRLGRIVSLRREPSDWETIAPASD